MVGCGWLWAETRGNMVSSAPRQQQSTRAASGGAAGTWKEGRVVGGTALCGGAAGGMGVGVVMQVGWARGALAVPTVGLWGIVGYGGSPKISGTQLRTGTASSVSMPGAWGAEHTAINKGPGYGSGQGAAGVAYSSSMLVGGSGTILSGGWASWPHATLLGNTCPNKS
jgi:hypothetical protein